MASGSLMPLKIIDQSSATIQTDTNVNTDQVPNINASSISDTHRMIPRNNIKS
ncbi:MAG: hypothetical protein ACRD8W_23810 [Nitrososphaeraceae archaeon]